MQNTLGSLLRIIAVSRVCVVTSIVFFDEIEETLSDKMEVETRRDLSVGE